MSKVSRLMSTTALLLVAGMSLASAQGVSREPNAPAAAPNAQSPSAPKAGAQQRPEQSCRRTVVANGVVTATAVRVRQTPRTVTRPPAKQHPARTVQPNRAVPSGRTLATPSAVRRTTARVSRARPSSPTNAVSRPSSAARTRRTRTRRSKVHNATRTRRTRVHSAESVISPTGCPTRPGAAAPRCGARSEARDQTYGPRLTCQHLDRAAHAHPPDHRQGRTMRLASPT